MCETLKIFFSVLTNEMNGKIVQLIEEELLFKVPDFGTAAILIQIFKGISAHAIPSPWLSA